MLSILVLTILALSFAAPLVSVKAIETPNVSSDTVNVGETITVFGTTSDVTSGSEVKVYWDISTGPDAHLLNTTQALNNGNYSVEIDIPAAISGTHYVWIEDVATTTRKMSDIITVEPELDVDPDSGLAGDTVTLTGTGFVESDGFNVSIFNITSGIMDISVDIVDDNDEETDANGGFEISIDIPATVNDYDDYRINVTDGTNNNISIAFTIGASITITPDEGPEGSVVTIAGRGFEDVTLNETDISFFEWDGVQIVDDTIDIEDGVFSGQVVVPSWGTGEWNFTVADGTNSATEAFEIDGAAAITVDPTYGAPGAIVTVNGYNFTQIAGEEITLDLNGTALGTVDTAADGTWTTTFTVPAVEFEQYVVNATTASDGINATDGFKVGIIAIIISPTSGPAGTEVSLTGTGFAEGTYNATLSDENVISLGTVSSGETLADTFFVPSIATGSYTVTVNDSDSNELTASYTVTGETSLTPTPSDVAIGYNISLYGENFAEQNTTTLVWYVYNSTDTLNITGNVNYTDMDTDIMVSGDGNFTGIWTVTDWVLLGNTYTVNATDAEGMFAETTMTIIEEEVDIGPNSASYSLGDTVTFTIRATFEKTNSVLEIVDPSGEIYFETVFEADDWTEVDPWQVVQIRDQIDDASFYPYIIPSDAATGTWVWSLYEDDDADSDIIKNGTITILPTTASQVDAQLTEIEDSLFDLAIDLEDVSDDVDDLYSELYSEIGDVASDVNALSSEIGDVASDVNALSSEIGDIVGGLADDISSATSAANAAGDAVEDLESSLDDLEDSVSDIADIADSAETAANAAADAASDAASAADDASSAASGLTTLVYGAIGASLIAALAAIVSLMQISRRIAG